MQQRTRELLAALEAADGFSAVGQPVPEPLRTKVTVVSSGHEAVECCGSISWEDLILEQQNLLTSSPSAGMGRLPRSCKRVLLSGCRGISRVCPSRRNRCRALPHGAVWGRKQPREADLKRRHPQPERLHQGRLYGRRGRMRLHFANNFVQ